MADISNITTPDGTTYDIKDSTARSQSGVSGVKGSSETTYRTGNVDLSASDLGLFNQTAASGGTAVSLVTTGEKYTWNNKQNALTNPVTGTGTSGYLAKWNGTGTVTSGPQLGSSTTTYLRNNGTWGAPAVPTKMSDLEQDVDYVMGTGSTGYLAEWDGEGTITSGPQFGSSTTTFLRNDGSWATPASGSGTVTKITAGTGLTGGDITTTGTINHSNSVTAQTTQAVYPIKIDAQGHISAYGTAVTSMTPSSHTHGNITNAGDITTTATIASGDRLVINDESASKINNSSITFGTSTTTFLRNDGTWATPAGGSSTKIVTGRTSQFTAKSSSTTTAVANHSGFSSTPKVVGTFYSLSSTTNQLVLMITSQTATSTTFTIRNNGTAERKGYVDWIAIGE